MFQYNQAYFSETQRCLYSHVFLPHLQTQLETRDLGIIDCRIPSHAHTHCRQESHEQTPAIFQKVRGYSGQSSCKLHCHLLTHTYTHEFISPHTLYFYCHNTHKQIIPLQLQGHTLTPRNCMSHKHTHTPLSVQLTWKENIWTHTWQQNA